MASKYVKHIIHLLFTVQVPSLCVLHSFLLPTFLSGGEQPCPGRSLPPAWPRQGAPVHGADPEAHCDALRDRDQAAQGGRGEGGPGRDGKGAVLVHLQLGGGEDQSQAGHRYQAGGLGGKGF